ncbi:hypothetical protein O0I10_000461 [Lichtheimia ornata]|uniref:Uncharacterized protein n=1 Tax=Lichtheimia ornata TaxID=688661 RepID=A0AAD7Y5Q6_9FUNG|nr:uncharacterized protein O0I10_000461 [Lichtheimia ornata]KAJ8664182.1 hypothetical protein O0I10_000461 [Lichtheimia ornata]
MGNVGFLLQHKLGLANSTSWLKFHVQCRNQPKNILVVVVEDVDPRSAPCLPRIQSNRLDKETGNQFSTPPLSYARAARVQRPTRI